MAKFDTFDGPEGKEKIGPNPEQEFTGLMREMARIYNYDFGPEENEFKSALRGVERLDLDRVVTLTLTTYEDEVDPVINRFEEVHDKVGSAYEDLVRNFEKLSGLVDKHPDVLGVGDYKKKLEAAGWILGLVEVRMQEADAVRDKILTAVDSRQSEAIGLLDNGFRAATWVGAKGFNVFIGSNSKVGKFARRKRAALERGIHSWVGEDE
jgi:hypothetical protein